MSTVDEDQVLGSSTVKRRRFPAADVDFWRSQRAKVLKVGKWIYAE
jgi:hypothetical protein